MQNFFTAESFAGRVALVTGATRGIGRAVALALPSGAHHHRLSAMAGSIAISQAE